VQRDHNETEDTLPGSSFAVSCEQDDRNQGDARAEALRNAEYASLTRRAATDDSRALVADVVRMVIEAETRKRQRVGKADAFKQAVEGFLGDLLAATGEGWISRATGRSHFTDAVVSYRDFTAVRQSLLKLGLLQEVPGVQGFGKPATRFKATPLLEQLAAQYGIQPSEADRHFILPLPEHPLRLKGKSTWVWGQKIDGKEMEIDYSDAKVKALERTIIDLNDFLEGFDIGGGTHRGYIRQFECGDHERFDWNLGGRLYSQGQHNYQQLSPAERLMMTINGKPVCDIDVRASTFTIFQALGGHPLDFANNPDLDPYALPGFPRDVVKKFITATFGSGQLPAKWPSDVAWEYQMKTGNRLSKAHPISRVRDAVARAYPPLAQLRRDDSMPPIWARLMHLESEAVLGTMVALQAAGIPSLSVHDSLIVQQDHEQMARVTLSDLYKATTGATPRTVTHYNNNTELP
jgi:hypothetical protein